MASLPKDLSKLITMVTDHMNASMVMDVPQGRHEKLINQFCEDFDYNSADQLSRLSYVWTNLHDFNDFLEKQINFSSSRLNAERHAKLQPERLQKAIVSISDLGFEVTTLNDGEISFLYKGEKIRYFPYSGWASGKTITDGRGLENLLKQLK